MQIQTSIIAARVLEIAPNGWRRPVSASPVREAYLLTYSTSTIAVSCMTSELFDGSIDPTIEFRDREELLQVSPLAKQHTTSSDDTAGQHGQVQSTDQLLRDSIVPLDLYTENGVYWADLPFAQRVRDRSFSSVLPKLDVLAWWQWTWVQAQDRAELAREWKLVWNMFKVDPLAPFLAYWR